MKPSRHPLLPSLSRHGDAERPHDGSFQGATTDRHYCQKTNAQFGDRMDRFARRKPGDPYPVVAVEALLLCIQQLRAETMKHIEPNLGNRHSKRGLDSISGAATINDRGIRVFKATHSWVRGGLVRSHYCGSNPSCRTLVSAIINARTAGQTCATAARGRREHFPGRPRSGSGAEAGRSVLRHLPQRAHEDRRSGARADATRSRALR